MPRKEAVDLPQGPHLKVGTVLTSVNDAACRLRRRAEEITLDEVERILV